MNTVTAAPRRFLTHDEVESIPDRHGKLHRFRFRVWNARGMAPAVLISQVEGETLPERLLNKLINYANSALCRYPETGILVFISDLAPCIRSLQQVYFETYGHSDRLRLFKPLLQMKDWEYIEFVVGEPVER